MHFAPQGPLQSWGPIARYGNVPFQATAKPSQAAAAGAFETGGISAELGRRTNPLRGRFVRDGLGSWIWVDCDFD